MYVCMYACAFIPWLCNGVYKPKGPYPNQIKSNTNSYQGQVSDRSREVKFWKNQRYQYKLIKYKYQYNNHRIPSQESVCGAFHIFRMLSIVSPKNRFKNGTVNSCSHFIRTFRVKHVILLWTCVLGLLVDSSLHTFQFYVLYYVYLLNPPLAGGRHTHPWWTLAITP